MDGTTAPIGLGESGGLLWPFLQPWRGDLGAARFRRGDLVRGTGTGTSSQAPSGGQDMPVAVEGLGEQLAATDASTTFLSDAAPATAEDVQERAVEMLQGLMQSREDIESVPWNLASSLLDDAAGPVALAAESAMEGNRLAVGEVSLAASVPPLALACVPCGPDAASVSLARLVAPADGAPRLEPQRLCSADALQAPIQQLALFPLPAGSAPRCAASSEGALLPLLAWVAIRTPCQMGVMEVRGSSEAASGPQQGTPGTPRPVSMELAAATGPLPEFLAHACWNPLCLGELAFTRRDGSAWVLDVYRPLHQDRRPPQGGGGAISLQPSELLPPRSLCQALTPDQDGPDGDSGLCIHPVLAEFGNQPRQLVTASGRRLLRWQLTKSAGGLNLGGEAVPGHRKRPVELFLANKGENMIALAVPRTGPSRHCVVAGTTTRLLLVDSRRPGGVLLMWRLDSDKIPPRLLSLVPSRSGQKPNNAGDASNPFAAPQPSGLRNLHSCSEKRMLLAASPIGPGEVLGYTFLCRAQTSRLTVEASDMDRVARQASTPRGSVPGPRPVPVCITELGTCGSAPEMRRFGDGQGDGSLQASGGAWGWNPIFTAVAEAGGLPVRIAKSLKRARDDRLIEASEGDADSLPDVTAQMAGVEQNGKDDLAGLAMINIDEHNFLARLDGQGNLLIHCCSSPDSQHVPPAKRASPGALSHTVLGSATVGPVEGRVSSKGVKIQSLAHHRALLKRSLAGIQPQLDAGDIHGLQADADPRNGADTDCRLLESSRLPLIAREAAADLLESASTSSSALVPLGQALDGGHRQQHARQGQKMPSLEELVRRLGQANGEEARQLKGRALAHLERLSRPTLFSSPRQEPVSKHRISIPLLGVKQHGSSPRRHRQEQEGTALGAPHDRTPMEPLAEQWAKEKFRKILAPAIDGTVLHRPAKEHASAQLYSITARGEGSSIPSATRSFLRTPSELAQKVAGDLDVEWAGTPGETVDPSQTTPFADSQGTLTPASEFSFGFQSWTPKQIVQTPSEDRHLRPPQVPGSTTSVQVRQQPQHNDTESRQVLPASCPPDFNSDRHREKKKRRKDGGRKAWVRPAQQSQAGF